MTYRGQQKKENAPATLVPFVRPVHVENILFHKDNFYERNIIMKKCNLRWARSTPAHPTKCVLKMNSRICDSRLYLKSHTFYIGTFFHLATVKKYIIYSMKVCNMNIIQTYMHTSESHQKL